MRAIAAELKSGSELYREVMLDKLTHARESVWIAAFAAISRLVREAPAAVEEAVIVDKAWVYLGNANLTGAGLGTKADGRRNFELGLCTEDFDTLDRVSALRGNLERRGMRLLQAAPHLPRSDRTSPTEIIGPSWPSPPPRPLAPHPPPPPGAPKKNFFSLPRGMSDPPGRVGA